MTEFSMVTVTPLFSGGSEGRGTLNDPAPPELRPPAFRGALRYWLRAAAGGALGDSPQDVAQVEGDVFGTVDDIASHASAVTTRIIPKQLKAPLPYNKDAMGRAKKVVKNGREIYQATGRSYLYWPMADFPGQDMPPRQYFPEGSTFSLILSARPGAPGGLQAVRKATAALWLLAQLGGIGSRSRRTAGSLAVQAPGVVEGLPFQLKGRTPELVAKELQTGLRQVHSIFAVPGKTPTISDPPAFDVLSTDKDICRIWVLGLWPDAMQAVEEVGWSMGWFRTYREPDHRNVATWLKGGDIPTVERAAFGLPIPVRYSNHGPQGTIQGRSKGPGSQAAIDRRASPLWLSISPAGGGFVAVATLFKAAFLPRGEELHAKTADRPPAVPLPPDYDIVEDWITTFKTRQEVSYA